MGIKSAWEQAQAAPWTLRKKFSVVVEKTARELQGIACLELEDPEPARQEICCSRMFGQRLREIEPIREAVATYCTRAAEKLRGQGSVCRRVRVSVRTGMFNPDEAKYANGVVCQLPYPTDDTRELIRACIAGLAKVFRPGFAYSKAEVLLMDLCQRNEYTGDLFTPVQPEAANRVLGVLDQINAKWGRGTIPPRSRTDSAGLGHAARDEEPQLHHQPGRAVARSLPMNIGWLNGMIRTPNS